MSVASVVSLVAISSGRCELHRHYCEGVGGSERTLHRQIAGDYLFPSLTRIGLCGIGPVSVRCDRPDYRHLVPGPGLAGALGATA